MTLYFVLRGSVKKEPLGLEKKQNNEIESIMELTWATKPQDLYHDLCRYLLYECFGK